MNMTPQESGNGYGAFPAARWGMEREKRTVLIVDSSASSIFYISMLLRQLEYKVQKATSAEDALTIIAGSAPAAVITDTLLPRMSGVDLLRHMKNNVSISFIPVLVHTADADPALKDACAEAGCAGYFAKPVAPEVLFRAIQTATETTPRKNIRIPVSLKVRIEGNPLRYQEATSLSENGLYVKTSAPSPVDAALPLTLFLGSREIRLTARVLYSSAKAVGGLHTVPGMGMKFESILPEDREAIREFIRVQVTNSLPIGK